MKSLQQFALIIVIMVLPAYLSVMAICASLTWSNSNAGNITSILLKPSSTVNHDLVALCESSQFCLEPNEVKHLEEVSLRIHQMRAIVLVGILTLYLSTSLSPPFPRQNFHRFVKYLILMTLIILPFILATWNTFFTTFHQLFFPQGNWAFPENSLLIQTYPDHFWYMTALKIIVLLLLQYGGMYYFSRFKK